MISWQDAHLLAAADVGRRFRGYVERDDLLSEGYVWALEHKKRLAQYDEDENPKRGQYRLLRDLTMHMEKYARAQKAAALGYNPDDEAFYSEGMVEAILPAVLAGDWEPPQVEEGQPHGQNDPAEGGSWIAQLMDVSRAWNNAKLSEQERASVLMYYGIGMPQTEVGAALNVSQKTVSVRLSSALKKIVALLGGDRPQGCPYTCECHEGKLRVRPGIHSEISGKNQELR